jgi:hypothetical protein
MGRKRGRSGRGGLFPGFVLLGLGIAFLLDRLHVVEMRGGSFWRWWPALLIFLGIQHLQESRKRGWGVTLLALGAVYLLINFEVAGLTWQTGWPLILVAVGLGFIAGAFLRRGSEASDEAE